MILKIKKLYKDATIPTRESADAAGYDLYAYLESDICIIPSKNTVKIPVGFAVEIPKGYFGAIFARSGLATKQGLRPANCVGKL